MAALDPELVRILADERDSIVPLVGAGLAVDAGYPTARGLAELLIKDREIDANPNDLGAVCDLIEAAEGRESLAGWVADRFSQVEVSSTRANELIARCPSRIVATTNYDEAIEVAAENVGLEPETLLPNDPRALEPPGEGKLHVLHLHGHVSDLASMVLSGKHRLEMTSDPAFIQTLRALITPRRLFCVGYRLGPQEEHIRHQLFWVQSLYQPEKPHLILAAEEEGGREDLDALRRDGILRSFFFDSKASFDPVQQAALRLAPTAPVGSEHLAAPAPERSEYFLEPAMIRVDETERGDLDAQRTSVILAELDRDERGFASPLALAEAARSVLIAPPGHGKTEVLLQCGDQCEPGSAIFVTLPALAGSLSAQGGARGFARCVATGFAFDRETVLPTMETLENASYTFLLDALDECPAEARAGVVAEIKNAAERWPQHTFIVSTRPTSAASDLEENGFATFRIHEADLWGRRYLEHRGVPKADVAVVLERAPSLDQLIRIPIYATYLAERLVEEGVEHLPRTGLHLIIDFERRALAREAKREGTTNDELFAFVQRIAVALELSGRNQAEPSELAAIPAPGHLSSEEARQQLINASLLRDLPEGAQLSTTVAQEALCARAILCSDDPLALLREVAMAEVAGDWVFRGDTDHMLDLLYEAAPSDLRDQLRELDPLRWARTALVDAGDEEVLGAMETIRDWYRDRLLWLTMSSEGPGRSPGQTLALLAAAHPSVITSWRGQLIEDMRHPERTIRGNAVEILAFATDDVDDSESLIRMLGDEDDVVRRIAAHAIGDRPVPGAVPALAEAWQKEGDELAAEAIGHAIVTVAPSEDLAALAIELSEGRVGWERAGYLFEDALPLQGVLDLLEQGHLTPHQTHDLVDKVLKAIDKESPSASEWPAGDVRRFVRFISRDLGELHGHSRSDRLAELVRHQPEAALAGLAEAGPDDLSWLDIYWLREVDRDLLRSHAVGTLAAPLRDLLERLEARDQEPPPEPVVAPAQAPEPGLEEMLEAGAIAEDSVPWHTKLYDANELAVDSQERLLELAHGWLPELPPKGKRMELRATNGILGATAVFTSLDAVVAPVEWLVIVASGALGPADRIADWASRRFPTAQETDVADLIREADTDDQLRSIIPAVPKTWPPAIRAAFADSLSEIEERYLAQHIVAALVQAADREALERALESAAGPVGLEIRKGMAELGDLESQLLLLDELATELESGQDSDSFHSGITWLAGIDDPQVLPALERLVRAMGNEDAPGIGLRSTTQAAVARCGVAGVEFWDRLTTDDELEHPSFYWYRRDELARDLARQEVQRRLPDSLAATLEHFNITGESHPAPGAVQA